MKLSQPQKIVAFLKSNPNQKFTARKIAEAILNLYPQDYLEKRNNPRFSTDAELINQIVAEIGAHKNAILKAEPLIQLQDKPRPRLYWYDPNIISNSLKIDTQNEPADFDDQQEVISTLTTKILSEYDLYPVLIEYLSKELQLFSLRIDEKKSSNNRGQNGNQWLHPDIVAMQPIDKKWHELIRTCVKHGSGQNVRLWSFEVKKELTGSNIRSSFFQAVSNSSWANEGYLVATSISTNEVEEELRMLSALHGIGVILLNPENPTESEILLPARRRSEVDWQSINRILTENLDFKNFIELVSIYYQTGRIRSQDWNH
ncbi:MULTISPECIES: COG2958 family protein [Acinetobacter]|uniref:HrgA protein n=1 Tax=Acinetobacter towneri TaxID=202956 RepID=A0AAP4HDT5_9GAMM|nr:MULTISPECIES: HrgA protein [Acinetobacter]MCA4798953.1 HrgA protein [Acinetobacter towneri]MDM1718752.1 HrgA protein [Acinetobacter towneri]MDM1730868.1 HrgA protein [Acinetobacter towneri]MDM1733584.1 HrgA protein [Acinetobacter towneri]MDM1735951.1 HrgA protein [Acinetobacter towneri]